VPPDVEKLLLSIGVAARYRVGKYRVCMSQGS
jgi:hypothetical protein